MRVVEADWIVVGSGPSGCAFAGSMGRLEKSHVIVMLESGGDANSKRVCDFPENLTNRPGFQVLPSGPWKECVVHGRLSYVGGGSAMNAGAFIEDSEYWTSDWNSGCEEDIDRQEDWSTESMHLATKRIVEILGGLECSNDWFSQSFVRAIATQDKTATIISNKMDRLPPFSSNSDNTVIAGAPATCFTRLGDRRQATELLVDSTRLLKNTRVRQIEFDQSGRVGLGVKTENGIFVTARRGIVIAAGPEATALLLFRSGLHKGIGLGFRDHPTVSWPVISFQTPPVNSPSYSGFAFFSTQLSSQTHKFQLSFLGHGMMSGCARLILLGHKFPIWLRIGARLISVLIPWLPRSLSIGVIACTVSKPRTTGHLLYDKDNDSLSVQAPPLCIEDRATLNLAVQRGFSIATAMRLWHRAAYYFMRRYVGTLWHSAGGAVRGLALEPSRLRVQGTSNIYVIGAAAMPQLPAANPMASCYAMGWRLAELLFADAMSS